MQSTVARVARSFRPLWTSCNELALNIDTAASPAPSTRNLNGDRAWWRAEFSSQAKHDDGSSYASPDYFYLYKIARILNPAPEDVFYDLGSGKGRMLCVMARRRLRKCVGIELFEPLCQMARQNAQRLRGRQSPIEIVCEDAAKADLSEGTVFFMANPFGLETMRDVLANIQKSLANNPRRISIAYHNAFHETALAERSWLEKCRTFHVANGKPVSFWRNRPGAGIQSEPCVQVTGLPHPGIGTVI